MTDTLDRTGEMKRWEQVRRIRRWHASKQRWENFWCLANTGTWEEVRHRLNQILRGWASYFSDGTRADAYRAVRNYVYESVRHFLRRRHQVQSRGTSRFSKETVFGELGVLQVRRAQLEARS
jgi:hypothetical protein